MSDPPRSPLQPLVTAALIVLLIVIGGALRLHRLAELPPRIAADEYTTALDVFAILHGGGPPLFGFDWKPMPALTTHLTAAVVRLTGPTIVGLRSPSVALTVLAGVLLFVVLRWTCATAVAWAAAVALLANPWFLNFSRSSWENAHVAAYWLLFTWCFFAALRAERRPAVWAVGAGVALALSWYGYFTGRLLLAAWLLYLPVAALLMRARWRRLALVYAVTSLTAALLFAPQVPQIVRDWDHFQKRVRNVSVLQADPAEHGYQPGTSRAAMIAAQLGSTARYFTIGARIGKVHYSPTDRPPFHYLLVPFLLVGLVAAAVRWRDGAWWWLLLIVSVGATQGLSIDAPDLARLAGAAVVFFWFIGYGAEALVRLLAVRWRGAAGIALALGSLLLGAVEWRFFCRWMMADGVAITRGGGVDYREYDQWQAMQYRRLAAGKSPIPVVEWERPAVHEAVLAGKDPPSP